MRRKVKTAVVPVAGLGTRCLPATKANPKEMLPVVDKPLIQYAAEEAVEAGIDTLIFVIGRTKRSIADHFDKAYELEVELEQRGKSEALASVRQILPAHVSCIYIRQAEALGLGHAVACARPVVGEEPFAVILADDLIDSRGPNALQQMVQIYERHGRSVIGVEEVPREETRHYGVVKVGSGGERLWDLQGIVEKPAPKDAPSNLAVVGRYVFTPRIFEMLEHTPRGAGGEIQLTDAIAKLMEVERVTAYRFAGKRFDCGTKLGYLQATVEYALHHPQLGDEFRSYLSELTPAEVFAPHEKRAKAG